MQSSASTSHHASALARRAARKALTDYFRQEGDPDPAESAARALATLDRVVVLRLRKKPGRPSKATDPRTVPFLFGSMLKEMTTNARSAAAAERTVAKKQWAVASGYSARTIGNVFRSHEKKLKEAFAAEGMAWPTELKRLTRQRAAKGRAARFQS